MSTTQRKVTSLILGLFLALAMFAGMGTNVSAAEQAWTGNVDIGWYVGHESATTYNISTPEQFAGLAAIVNGQLDKSTTQVLNNLTFTPAQPSNGIYSKGIDDMKGKTINLTSDLDMGGNKGSSVPNFTPIGGQ